MESVLKTYTREESADRWTGIAFVLFAFLYALYIHIVFLFMSQTFVYGIQISGVDSAFLIEAGGFAFWMFFLYIIAFVLLTILYFIKTDAKKLAVAGIVLPIVALHIARALITAYYPVTIFH